MKKNLFQTLYFKVLPILVAILFSNTLLAQVNYESYAINDENTVQVNNSSEFNEILVLNQDKEKKGKSSFKIFAGASFNNVDTSVDFESNTKTGFMIGASYKKGRFFYYEIGARYNYRAFGYGKEIESTDDTFSVSAIDVPITGGINLTSYIDKLIGVRLFISAVPSFVIGVENDNTSGIDKDDVESFIMTGQAGIGIDIAFFFIEAGYNYGFTNLLTTDVSDSNPSQAFAGIGFRF